MAVKKQIPESCYVPFVGAESLFQGVIGRWGLKEAFMAIVKMTLEEALKLKGTTDWDAVNALSDEQIIEAAKNDPDSAWQAKRNWKSLSALEKPLVKLKEQL